MPPPKGNEQDPRTPPGAPPVSTPRLRRYRERLFQGYVIAALVGFAVLFALARVVPYFALDLQIAHFIQALPLPGISAAMLFVSGLGFAPLSNLLVGCILIYVFLLGLRWETVMGVFAALGSGALGYVIKLIVHRARPTADLVNVLATLQDTSFPSGHVLEFTAFLGFLGFLIYILAPRSWRRNLGLVVCGLLISLVGISRIYMGQHWPSDVLGAYLLGSVWLAVTIYVYRWGKPRFFVHQPLAPPSAAEHARAQS